MALDVQPKILGVSRVWRTSQRFETSGLDQHGRHKKKPRGQFLSLQNQLPRWRRKKMAHIVLPRNQSEPSSEVLQSSRAPRSHDPESSRRRERHCVPKNCAKDALSGLIRNTCEGPPVGIHRGGNDGLFNMSWLFERGETPYVRLGVRVVGFFTRHPFWSLHM